MKLVNLIDCMKADISVILQSSPQNKGFKHSRALYSMWQYVVTIHRVAEETHKCTNNVSSTSMFAQQWVRREVAFPRLVNSRVGTEIGKHEEPIEKGKQYSSAGAPCQDWWEKRLPRKVRLVLSVPPGRPLQWLWVNNCYPHSSDEETEVQTC